MMGLSLSIVAASIGNAAFFAPEHVMDPESLLPPIIFNFSINYAVSDGDFVIKLRACSSPV